MYLINRKRFTLDNIAVLLKSDLHPANIEASIHKQSLAALKQLLASSGLEAVESLKAFRYNIPPGDFEQLCQQNYSDLFRLRDDFQLLQRTDLVEGLNLEAKALYTALWTMLEVLARYLEGTGIRGMAPHEMLPKYYLENRLCLLRKEMLLLQSKFQACSADGLLTGVILDHFRQFSIRQESSQQQLQYMEQLMAALLDMLKAGGAENQDLNLMHKVIQFNFNAPGAYQYCRDKILELLEDTQGSTRRMLLLTWQLKTLRQLLPVPGLALNLQYPELKVLLIDFVQAEISYQEVAVAESLQKHLQPAKSQKAPGQAGRFGKFRLQLSQRALAIVSQTLMSMDIIPLGVKEQRRFTEFLADHFTTAGLEEIIPDNFRRRYKEKHGSTSESVVDLLERMILFIKQEYMGIASPLKN